MDDLKFAVRQMLKDPGFTVVAVLTLALGIGANTAIFSLVNAALLQPLPFRQADRLVWIANPEPGEGLPGLTRRSNFIAWSSANKLFENLGAYVGFAQRIGYTLSGSGEPTRLEGAVVTVRFLETLGVNPMLGRGFVAAECERNGPRAILLSYRFWEERFQGDRTVVGKRLTINNLDWEIVGVLPKSFDFCDLFTPGARPIDFVRPYQDAPGYENWGNMFAVIGRLKPGVSILTAQAELDLMNDQLRTAHPEKGGFGARVTSLREKLSGSFQRPFVAVACAAFCVLLIACVNLSNLLLARGASRRPEFAVRLALGAGRVRLLRQLLVENILLAVAGSALALVVASIITKVVATSGTINIPLLQSARLDAAALVFTATIALATVLLFGLIPALQLSQTGSQTDLKDQARSVAAGRSASRLRQNLVIAEVALAFVLLAGAGLLLRSLSRLLDQDLGFRPEHVASWRIVPNREFPMHEQEVAFYEELVNRVQSLPGVESATLATTLPLELNDLARVRPKGASTRGATPNVFFREVGAMNYFKTIGITLRMGRDFEPQDVNAVPKPIIVNDSMARQFFPDAKAIDRIVVLENPPDPPLDCKIIGVVADMRQTALEQAAGPEMFMFSWGGRQLVVRTSRPLASVAPAVGATLRRLNPGMVVNDFVPLQKSVDRMVSSKLLVVLLVGSFSLLALLLAALGIYGVIAYSVSQRIREIGLRLALGSQRGAVLRLVMREGMLAAGIGCALGSAMALLLARAMQSLLFGISATDPVTLGSSAALLLGVALFACWVPARRAAGVQPMEALRYE